MQAVVVELKAGVSLTVSGCSCLKARQIIFHFLIGDEHRVLR